MGTHYQGSPEEVRALDTYIKLVRAVDSITTRVHRHLSKVDLTVSQFGVLEALLHLGPLHQRDLATKLLKSGGNITLVIDNLEKRGLVLRTRETDDRRYICVTLTETGEQLIRSIFPHHVEQVVRELSVLSPEKQETLAQLCRKVGKVSP